MESNDIPEIPDRGETSDIPGVPSGRGGGTKVNVCQQTARNLFQEFNLFLRKTAVHVALALAHSLARAALCRSHQLWTFKQWGRNLFTDESQYTLSHSDAREGV